MGIVESYNKTLTKRLFRIQDAHDLLTLHLSEKFQAWVKNLLIIVEDINNSITRLIDLSPAIAIKKKWVISQSSKTREGPMAMMNHDQLNVLVRYLLESGELERDSKRRATDKNWSPQIYHIKVQKNQPAKIIIIIKSFPRICIHNEITPF